MKMKKTPKTDQNVATSCPDCGRVFSSAKIMRIHWTKIHYNDIHKRSGKRANDAAKTSNAVSIILLRINNQDSNSQY